MFVLQNAPLPALETTGLSMVAIDVESVSAKFDLTLAVTETDDGFRASLEYATEIFDATTVDRMLAHLQTLLESAIAEPERPVSQLAMMSEEEQRVLFGWSASKSGQGIGTDPDAEDALADLENLSEDELNALIDRL